MPPETIRADNALASRLLALAWVQPGHLDVHVDGLNEAAIELASSELNKIQNFKAPRDKLVCILNCCKVIYRLLNDTNYLFQDRFHVTVHFTKTRWIQLGVEGICF